MANSNYYLGRDPVETLGDSPRYWYALRRTDDGELYLVRSDQLTDKEAYEINTVGTSSETFTDFEAGVDFFDGVDSDHNVVYDNLKYTQYKWDDRSIYYYVDPISGHLVMRINKSYTYPSGIAS
jgi:putative NADPH-quinone reductase